MRLASSRPVGRRQDDINVQVARSLLDYLPQQAVHSTNFLCKRTDKRARKEANKNYNKHICPRRLSPRQSDALLGLLDEEMVRLDNPGITGNVGLFAGGADEYEDAASSPGGTTTTDLPFGSTISVLIDNARLLRMNKARRIEKKQWRIRERGHREG